MAAHNFNNLTGQQFGEWTVLHRDIEHEAQLKQKTGHSSCAYWVCQCKCGKVQSIPSGNLLQGKTHMCNKCSSIYANSSQYLPHKNNYTKLNLIGQRFGKLKVIDKCEPSEGKTKWRCICDCGNVVSVIGSKLISGHTRSCGCLQKESARQKVIDLTGKRFGKLTVIERAENRNNKVYWKCLCDCGNYTTVNSMKLLHNWTHSCGCIKSYGEYVVKSIFTQNNIDYISERNYFNLKGSKGAKLRFDFIVNPNNNPYIIEVDGEQHFGLNRGKYNNIDKYNQLHINDMIKNNYCFDNHITLIRIPIKEINNIKLIDLLPGSRFEVNKDNIDNYYKTY